MVVVVGGYACQRERGEAAGDNGEASGHVASLRSKKGEQEGRIR